MTLKASITIKPRRVTFCCDAMWEDYQNNHIIFIEKEKFYVYALMNKGKSVLKYCYHCGAEILYQKIEKEKPKPQGEQRL